VAARGGKEGARVSMESIYGGEKGAGEAAVVVGVALGRTTGTSRFARERKKTTRGGCLPFWKRRGVGLDLGQRR
jgi:hypothetical protein